MRKSMMATANNMIPELDDFVVDHLMEGMSVYDAVMADYNSAMEFRDVPERSRRFRRRSDRQTQNLKWKNRGFMPDGTTRIAVDENGKEYVRCGSKRSIQNRDRNRSDRRKNRHSAKEELRSATYDRKVDVDALLEWALDVEQSTNEDWALLDLVTADTDTANLVNSKNRYYAVISVMTDYGDDFGGTYCRHYKISEKDLIKMGFVG